MKRVVAIVQPSKIEEVEDALEKLGISGMNLTEVMGFGHQKEPVEFYRDTENPVSFVPKIKVEVVVPVGLVDKAIEAIEKSASTGQIGDGKIFVTSIDHVMRIRTGEMDDAAL
jgi:nitrogen regulatory protein P-II 2